MTDWKERYRGQLARTLGVPVDVVEIGDTFAGYLMALDLMEGDEAECKAGYSAPNAVITAARAIPGADRARIAEMLSVHEEDV